MNVEKNCLACGHIFVARLSDHKRGWGRFCDKSCSAAYKCGQRPKDVNARHAKFSLWAATRWGERLALYGGQAPPTAKPIKLQVGKNAKIKQQPRQIDDDWDPSWDAHKTGE